MLIEFEKYLKERTVEDDLTDFIRKKYEGISDMGIELFQELLNVVQFTGHVCHQLNELREKVDQLLTPKASKKKC